MYRKIEDFINDWKAETIATLKIFRAVEEKSAFEKVNENVRSSARIAWHITQTTTEMPLNSDILDKDELENKLIPSSFKEIIDLFTLHSKKLISAVESKWTDESLNDDIQIYNQTWKRHKILSVLINHTIHHRGQLTVVMRLLGMKVPGIYGPSKEEWSQFGMDAQE